MEKARENKGVAISNCSVQKRRGLFDDGDIEIIAGTKARVLKSPKKFRIDESSLVLPAGSDSSISTELSSLQSIDGIKANQY